MLGIKKIDKMLFTSFIPPFIVTFMIAQFVLVMQTLWMYIDDIAGKGLGIFMITELLAYRSVSLIPLALPLAVLISSVMVLGNLGERYELSSIKSAGVSLVRLMRPLMFFGFIAAAFSYICAVYLIPEANLKFGSRMYDITRQKPTLKLEQGIFNDDFNGYTIHIGEKGRDGKEIRDVLIYDQKEANQGRVSQIVAENGEMYSTNDGRYFIMKLYNGYQYVETRPNGGRSYPFVRTSFENWTKVFDLGEFELKRTNEDLFKHNRSMLGVEELKSQVDTLSLRILKTKVDLSNSLTSYLRFLPRDSTYLRLMPKPVRPKVPEGVTPADPGLDSLATERTDSIAFALDSIKQARRDSLRNIQAAKGSGAVKGTAVVKSLDQQESTKKRKLLEKTKTGKGRTPPKTYSKKTTASAIKVNRYEVPEQIIEKPLSEYDSFIELFATKHHSKFKSKSLSAAKTIRSQAEQTLRRLDHLKEDKVKHIYDLHTKYSMAVACFIFMFIGAPMGAIVRKGGFGTPILVSIIFFMIFIVLTIFCRKIAESFVVPAEAAAWIPCLVLFPIGAFLTNKAMKDSKLLNADRYTRFFSRLFSKKKAVS